MVLAYKIDFCYLKMNSPEKFNLYQLISISFIDFSHNYHFTFELIFKLLNSLKEIDFKIIGFHFQCSLSLRH